jgi:hypothetical protein
MLANLKCPRKGLIGPWGHSYPHQGDPGPAIEWLPEALRWWDFLARNGARHAVIVEGQRPIGTVSQLGILRWLAWQAAAPGGAARRERQPAAAEASLALATT